MRNLDARRQRWTRVRVGVLAAALLVGAVLVGHRAYELQVVRAPTLKEMAEEQYLRDVRLAPKRGTIYDRHGAELAVSVEVDSVWADPRGLRKAGHEPSKVASKLAGILSTDRERIAARLRKERDFVWLERHVTPKQASGVDELGIEGVRMNKEAKRYYPNRNLASHVLGFANIDGKGIAGLELAFEDELRGKVRAVPAIRDRRGSIVFSQQLLDEAGSQGHDLVLTIDKTIQHIAERELSLAVKTFEAKAGSVVVMDPRNGELLAMANYPTFNPNEPGESPASHRRNRAVTDRFEPGSTVKPFTVAAALAEGTVHPEQTIDCENGAMEVANYTIHDSHRFDDLTPAQILAFSSNIGTAKIGRSLGRRGLYRAFRRFGFGEPTGLRIPGETGGILRHYKRWYEMDAATISFGQGMSVTTLQLATAMSALANEGRLMQPILVKRMEDGEGKPVETNLPRVRRQVIPDSVARLVSDMLTAVTGPDGTGTEAAIEGYLVAGKTGTAQKADYISGGYAEDKWLASFAGFVPAKDPRLAIAVVIDEPMIAHYGGTVAGPVFRRIGAAALRHLGVPASDGGRALAELQTPDEADMPDQDEPSSGESTTAEAHPSDPPLPIAPGREPKEGEVRVPDLAGKTARQVLTTLRKAGLEPAVQGSGTVAAQQPMAGKVVPKGTEIDVELQSPGYESEPSTPDGGVPELPPELEETLAYAGPEEVQQ
jgi:cell division protein FtsI (penicillin-binding protein 3)